MAKKYRGLLLVFVAFVVAVPVLLRPFVHDKLDEITVHVPEYQRPPDLGYDPAEISGATH